MNTVLQFIAQYFWNKPWHALIPAMLLTLLGIMGSLSLRIDNSIGIWFVEEDPELQRFEQFQNARGHAVQILYYARNTPQTLHWSPTHDWLDSLQKLGFQHRPLPMGGGKLGTLSHAPFQTEQHLTDTLALLRSVNSHFATQQGELAMAGPEIMNDAVNRATMQDSALFTGISYALIFVLLAFTLRKPAHIFLALWVVALALLITTGIWGISPYSLNIVTVIVPILVLILAIADTIHITHHGRNPHELGKVLRPCLWTTLTTALAFASLMFTQMPVIRTLGLFGCIGVLTAFLSALLILPAGLSLVGQRASVNPNSSTHAFDLPLHMPKRVVHMVFSLLMIFAVMGSTRLEIDNDTLAFLDPQHPVRQEFALVEKALGGLLEVEVILQDTATTQTLAPFSVFIPYGSARQQQKSLDSLRHHYKQLGQPVESLRGYSPLYARMVDYMLAGFIQSFSIAFLLVFIAMAIFLRSALLAVKAILPNLFPIACTLGYMGWRGIPLDMGTVVIATILLGFVVDDTIHLLDRFRQTQDIRKALALTASPMISTSLILTFGFLVLLGAEVSSLRHFGELAAVGILAALLGDLFWLPAFFGQTINSPPHLHSMNRSNIIQ